MNRCVAAWLLAAWVTGAGAAPARVTQLLAPAWLERAGVREPLRADSVLQNDDLIHTGPAARVVLALAEGSVVKLGAETDFHLKSLDEPADAEGTFNGFLDVLKGAFRFTTTLVGRKRNIEARVRTATIGIRGTDVWGKAEEARDFVVLIEGHIDITRDGQRTDMAAPLTVYMAPRGEPAQAPQPVDGADLTRWAAETEPQAGAGLLDAAGRHVLQLASLPDEAGARALQARLAEAGHAAEVSAADVGGRSWWRVSIGRYASRADAQAAAGALAADFSLTSPWVSGLPAQP